MITLSRKGYGRNDGNVCFIGEELIEVSTSRSELARRMKDALRIHVAPPARNAYHPAHSCIGIWVCGCGHDARIRIVDPNPIRMASRFPIVLKTALRFSQHRLQLSSQRRSRYTDQSLPPVRS